MWNIIPIVTKIKLDLPFIINKYLKNDSISIIQTKNEKNQTLNGKSTQKDFYYKTPIFLDLACRM